MPDNQEEKKKELEKTVISNNLQDEAAAENAIDEQQTPPAKEKQDSADKTIIMDYSKQKSEGGTQQPQDSPDKTIVIDYSKGQTSGESKPVQELSTLDKTIVVDYSKGQAPQDTESQQEVAPSDKTVVIDYSRQQEAKPKEMTPSDKTIVVDYGKGEKHPESKPAATSQPPQTKAAQIKAPINIPGYEIISKLGQGGMGAVYKGKQSALGRTVAIKVLASRLATDPTYIERFKREAKATALLNHKNIVGVYEAGEVQGFHYLVMEYVDGDAVDGLLQKKKTLDENEALDIITQTTEALRHAHEHNIIHRDIKPANIMMMKDGTVKLCDLGMAKQTEGELAKTLTQKDLVLGTPYFISPEQLTGEKLDIRTDLYSLGVALYLMMTGVYPFEGETMAEVASKRLTVDPVPPKKLKPDMNPNLSNLILKMMAKQRDYRHADPQALMDDIKKLREGGSIKAPPKPYTKWVAIAAVALIAFTGLIIWLFGGGGAKEQAKQFASTIKAADSLLNEHRYAQARLQLDKFNATEISIKKQKETKLKDVETATKIGFDALIAQVNSYISKSDYNDGYSMLKLSKQNFEKTSVEKDIDKEINNATEKIFSAASDKAAKIAQNGQYKEAIKTLNDAGVVLEKTSQEAKINDAIKSIASVISKDALKVINDSIQSYDYNAAVKKIDEVKTILKGTVAEKDFNNSCESQIGAIFDRAKEKVETLYKQEKYSEMIKELTEVTAVVKGTTIEEKLTQLFKSKVGTICKVAGDESEALFAKSQYRDAIEKLKGIKPILESTPDYKEMLAKSISSQAIRGASKLKEQVNADYDVKNIDKAISAVNDALDYYKDTSAEASIKELRKSIDDRAAKDFEALKKEVQKLYDDRNLDLLTTKLEDAVVAYKSTSVGSDIKWLKADYKEKTSDIRAKYKGFLDDVRSYITAKKYPEALKPAQQAIDLDPSNPEGYSYRASVKSNLYDPKDEDTKSETKKYLDEAVKDLDMAFKLQTARPKPDQQELARYHSVKGDIQFKRNNFKDAIWETSEAIKLDPNFAEAYLYRGYAYSRMNDLKNALADTDMAIKKGINSARAYCTLGAVKSSIGGYDVNEIIGNFNKAIELDGRLGVAYFYRGLVRERMVGNFKDALDDMTKAIDRLKVDVDDPEKGFDAKQILPDAYAGKAWALMEVAYLNAKDKEKFKDAVEEAGRDLKESVKYNENCELAYMVSGRIEALVGRDASGNVVNKDLIDEAVKDFTKATQLNPNDALAWANLGYLKCLLKDNAEGLRLINKAIEVNPKCADAFVYRGEVNFYVYSKYKEAYEDYKKALDLRPGIKDVYNLGDRLQKAKDKAGIKD